MRAFTKQRSFFEFVTFSVLIVVGLIAPPSISAESASMLTSIPAIHPIAGASERMELTVDSTRILTLGTRIPKFQVHDEDVLDATPVSDHRIQISAKKPGATQLNVWDTQNKVYTIDVTVVADASPIDDLLNSQLPLASLNVTPINESAIVAGFVTRAGDAERAVAIVEQFYKTVINNIQVVGTTQVLLHTQIMEVSRTKLRQLGLNTPWCHRSEQSRESGHCFRIDGHLEALIQTLEKQDLVNVLASPTVVATDGRHARFVVGGRVPNVLPSRTGEVNIEYEEYGTSIDFLPTVIAPDRIRLVVRPEVSEPDPQRSVEIGSTKASAFTTRYVETVVEMHADETILLAQLLQSRDVSVIKRTPVLGDIPCIGALFRQVRCEHNEIDLLITITPELVTATTPGQCLIMPENRAYEDDGEWAAVETHGKTEGMIHQDENRATPEIVSPSDLLPSKSGIVTNRK